MNCEKCKEYVEVNPESIIIGDIYCLECAKIIETVNINYAKDKVWDED